MITLYIYSFIYTHLICIFTPTWIIWIIKENFINWYRIATHKENVNLRSNSRLILNVKIQQNSFLDIDKREVRTSGTVTIHLEYIRQNILGVTLNNTTVSLIFKVNKVKWAWEKHEYWKHLNNTELFPWNIIFSKSCERAIKRFWHFKSWLFK